MNLTPEMIDIILKILLDVFGVIASIGAAYGAMLIKKKYNNEQIKNIKDKLTLIEQLAIQACRFAEQNGLDLDAKGNEKLNMAVKWLSDRLTQEGIAIDEEQIMGFVKSALRILKDEFGDDWGRIDA